ncbi:hypothetical protein QT972_18290 [Microcoleus sp. herbarium7]|uniref:hypothetical protein n=1 Tax=Microcoleus sp. herbarium7 TaxID=3055435 RepID=UPI002FD5A450
MAEEAVKPTPLRLLVSEEFKSRLKAQAGRMGVTMGEIIEAVATKPLRELELKSVQASGNEQPETFKDLIRQKYFELMNSGKLGHQRLKELSFGQKPTIKERQLISQILELDSLPED